MGVPYSESIVSAPTPNTSRSLRTQKSPTAFQHAWSYPWVRLLVFVLAAYLAWRLAGEIRSVLVDFAVAFLIAYLANPLLVWLERGRLKRGLGVFFVVLIFLGIFGLAGALLVTVSTQLV